MPARALPRPQRPDRLAARQVVTVREETIMDETEYGTDDPYGETLAASAEGFYYPYPNRERWARAQDRPCLACGETPCVSGYLPGTCIGER